ncbi:MAG: cysteine--tRNA ligase [Nanoarchaeota archaeon]|nr:cysteine--tRNA ligase [DPANN group archaeon]MBL7116346.1 cysteine--tRNA ligase [Nanoarchaeota archaeon]
MTLKVFNTLTRKKEVFEPLKGKNVNMFVCGPTVYDYSHIGHAKTYVQFDVIAKYLRYRGYDVFYLQNITDIDDKIIKRANEQSQKAERVAKRFEEEYYKDVEALGIDSVDKYARATDHIKQIVKQIKTLFEKGYAYETSDGVYFEIDKFKEYGKLSHQPLDKIKEGARVAVNEDKKNPSDFSLWKKQKPKEPYWSSPWEKGRPGWHIEDTAITETFFGSQYDLHGGAVDLIFPHHESEIAQMEASSGKKPLVKYWLHTAFLNIEKEKMAKSLGNFLTIREALSKWNTKVLRFFYASTHYRTPIEYSEKNVNQAKNALERINEFIRKVSRADGKDNKKVRELIKKTSDKFEKHMDDDFDIPQAIAALYDFIRDVNKLEISKKNGEEIIEFLKKINSVLGFMTFEKEKVPPSIMKLVEEREQYRKEKNFAEADKVRAELKKKGYYVDDTAQGPVVKKL